MKNEFCQAITMGAHTVKNYIKSQVGLTIQLAIFPLKSKYKDTDVWNLTYWILCFGNQLLKNEFCQVLMFDLIVYEHILYLSWIDDPTSNILLKVQILILSFIYRQSPHEEWVLPIHYVGVHTVKKLYLITSWTNTPFSNIPIKVQIQRYRCLKLDIFGLIFRQSALEKWVLPSLNVWSCSLR